MRGEEEDVVQVIYQLRHGNTLRPSEHGGGLTEDTAMTSLMSSFTNTITRSSSGREVKGNIYIYFFKKQSRIFLTETTQPACVLKQQQRAGSSLARNMGASQSNASVAASSNSSAPAAATGLNAAVRLSSLTDDVESRMASSIKWAAGAFKKMTASSEKKNGASANSLQRRSKRKRWSGEVEEKSGPDRTIQVPDEILAMIFVLVDAEVSVRDIFILTLQRSSCK